MISNTLETQKKYSLETLPDSARELYELALKNIDYSDPTKFPEIFKDQLLTIDDECGWTYDCHTLAGSMMHNMGVTNFPLILPNEDDFPVSGYKEHSSYSQQMTGIYQKLNRENPEEFNRILDFRAFFMDHAGIKIPFNIVMRGGMTPPVKKPDKIDRAVGAILAKSFGSNIQSRFGMIVTNRGTKKVDRHAFIMLGPTQDGEDLIVLDKAFLGADRGTFRVRKVSDIVYYYRHLNRLGLDKNEILLSADGIECDIDASVNYRENSSNN